MAKISLFRFVICLPIVAGLVFAYFAYRRNSALDRFNYAIENNKIVTSMDLERLLNTFGEPRTREIISFKASEFETLQYDGDNRMLQIVKSRHEYDNDNSDMCCLHLIGKFGFPCWSGPYGTRIKSVEIAGEKILVDIYGELEWETHKLTIPPDKSETYTFEWPAGSNPPGGHFGDLILSRHRNDLTRKKTTKNAG